MTDKPRWFRRMAAVMSLLSAAVLAPALTGCSTNPVTGEESFTAFMSPADEARVGREQDPRIREQFGGTYQDPALQAYVDQIGRRLAQYTETPGQTFTFTILNSPDVNAFALPGGFVYITRGLLALAETEAELAGVVAHEIGHVTARHSAERYSRAVASSIGAVLLGVLFDSKAVADLASTGAALYVQGYSRDQEFQADTLAIRYMTRAGYDPEAMASFLSRMGRYADLQAELVGAGSETQRYNLMSSHPRTADRVRAAIQQAGGPVGATPRIGREEHLRAINGMIFGDDPSQGFVRGTVFAHPGLGFRFEVPHGFRLLNRPDAVLAVGPDDVRMRLDRVQWRGGGGVVDYLTRVWAKGTALGGVRGLTINGYEAATGVARSTANGQTIAIRLVAIRFRDGSIYRFVVVLPGRAISRYERDVQRTVFSFRALSSEEASSYRARRLQVSTIPRPASAAEVAGAMATIPAADKQFYLLNDLTAGDRIDPTRHIKLVVE
jgi:predicted Zn-dependent protease